MNNQNELLTIPESQIDAILNIAKPLKYSSSTNLFYAGQIPIVAYLLLGGLVHFTKNGTVVNTFSRGSVIGLKELMNNETVDVDAQILSGTEVCFIDRSTVLGILEQKRPSPLNDVIKKLLRVNTTLRE